MLFKEILKKHNVNIEFPEPLLELGLDGTFTDYNIKTCQDESIMYTFYDQNSSIRIIPDKEDEIAIVHYQFKDGEDIGTATFYNWRGIPVADEVAMRTLG